RDFVCAAGIKRPDLVGPFFEVGIVSHAALQCDRLILGLTGRLATGAGVAPLAVGDDLGLALQGRHFADAGDIDADGGIGELDPELEIFIRIVTTRIGRELGVSHAKTPFQVWMLPAICWILMITHSAGFSGATPTALLTMPRLM